MPNCIVCRLLVQDTLSANCATRTARPCGRFVAGPIDCNVTPAGLIPLKVIFVNAVSILDGGPIQPLAWAPVQSPNVTLSFCHAALNSLTRRLLIWRV